MSQQTQRPEKEFQASGNGVSIKAAVWRNETQRDGQTVVNYSIRLQKRYYDRDAKSWQDSDSYWPSDVPLLGLVAQKAYEYTTLKERGLRGHSCRWIAWLLFNMERISARSPPLASGLTFSIEETHWHESPTRFIMCTHRPLLQTLSEQITFATSSDMHRPIHAHTSVSLATSCSLSHQPH